MSTTTMTETEAGAYLTTLFLTGWRTKYSSVAIVKLENEVFTEPAHQPLNQPGTFWVSMWLDYMGSQQETLGPIARRSFENLVTVHIDMYYQANRGTTQLRDMTQTARDIFQNQQLTNMRLVGIRPMNLGNDARWAMRSALVGVVYYEQK